MDLVSIHLGDRNQTALRDVSLVIRPPSAELRHDVVFEHEETGRYGVASGPVGVGSIPDGARIVAVIAVFPRPS